MTEDSCIDINNFSKKNHHHRLINYVNDLSYELHSMKKATWVIKDPYFSREQVFSV